MRVNNLAGIGDNWGAETSPSGSEGAYLNSMDAAAPGIVELARQAATAGESLIQTVARIRTAVQMTDLQRNELNAQLSRYAQGLPPVVKSAGSFSPALLLGGLLLLFVMLNSRGARS